MKNIDWRTDWLRRFTKLLTTLFQWPNDGQAAKKNLDKSKLTAAKTKRYKLSARLYFQILLDKNVSRVSELIVEYGIEKKIES